MKKILLGTTALVGAGLIAGSAAAQDGINLSLGGKMEQYFGMVHWDGSVTNASNASPTPTAAEQVAILVATGGVTAAQANTLVTGGAVTVTPNFYRSNLGNFGINTDTELYATGSTTLDNGLNIKAVYQLEAQTNETTDGDEQYVEVSGGFGTIRAGQKNTYSSDLANTAPSIELGNMVADFNKQGLVTTDFGTVAEIGGTGKYTATVNAAARTATITNNGVAPSFSNIGHDTTWSADDATVAYLSPAIFGFQTFIGFKPNPGGALAAQKAAATGTSNQLESGVAWNGSFGGFDLNADAAMVNAVGNGNTQATRTANGMNQFRYGMNAGFGGFTVGGSYMMVDNGGALVAGAGANDGYVWDAGVGWSGGPYSATFTHVKQAAAGADDNDTATKDEIKYYALAGGYALGPGIDLVASLWHAENDEELGSSTKNWGLTSGLKLSF